MISIEEYEKKKQQISHELLTLKKKGSIALGKSTSNLFRNRNQKNVKKIDVHNFNNVIRIDNQNLAAEVEGMTTYEELVSETLKCGLMPTVVPELKSITIGGACSGLGIESSSFKYGLVHETIQEIEILLGDGKTVSCSKENEHKDLFFGFPNSYGTLGYVLKLKVKLVPVKKHVKINHMRYDNPGDYFQALKKLADQKQVNFLDGVIFNENEMYVTTGEFTDKVPFVSDYTYMNIYYRSIREKEVDYLKTCDYIWRWDSDWFWCSKVFLVQNPLIRFFWGRRNLNSRIYKKISELNHKYPILEKLGVFGKRESVIQDVQIPVNFCESFLDFFHKEIKIKPIWVCPSVIYDKKINYPLYPMEPDTLYVNFGFWDTVRTENQEGYHNRLLEKEVRELKGKKSLYSTSHYSCEEFWELYNKEEYDKLKAKYDPSGTFRNLFEKCVLKK